MVKVKVFRHIDTLQNYLTDNYISRNNIITLDMRASSSTTDVIFFLAYEENLLNDLNPVEEFLGRNGKQIDNPFWLNPAPINTALN